MLAVVVTPVKAKGFEQWGSAALIIPALTGCNYGQFLGQFHDFAYPHMLKSCGSIINMPESNKSPRHINIELDFGKTAIALDPQFFARLCVQFGINYLRLTGSMRSGGSTTPSPTSDFDFCYRRFPGLFHRLNRVERAQFSEVVREQYGRRADLVSVVDLFTRDTDPFNTWNALVDSCYDRSMSCLYRIDKTYGRLDHSLAIFGRNKSYFTEPIRDLQYEVRLLRFAFLIGIDTRIPMRNWPAKKYPDFPWNEFSAEAVSSLRFELMSEGDSQISFAEVADRWERKRSERAARVLKWRQRFSEIAKAELTVQPPEFPKDLKLRLLSGGPVLKQTQ